ncbi:MAG: serine/threonine-protein kinase [Planctomycetaceae bacterium]
MDRSRRELLSEYVLEWEDGFLAGRDIPAKDLAWKHPELIEPLARRIRVLKATSWIDHPSDDHTADEAESSPPGGRVLGGRYRLDERIAVGGFAEVWKAFDAELRRVVAVKIPKAARIALNDAFMAEARRVARLRHPSIVAVHDVGIDGDDCFIVSDYMDGGSLADRIASGPVERRQALRWVAQIADALDYAHRNGVIHRDVKPANILVNHHGDAALADFGIAQSATKTGEFAPSMGTLRYMAPEQLEGGSSGPAADVYSLGIVLHEVIAGATPHSSDAPAAIRNEVMGPRDLPISPATPPRVAAICRRAIQRDPARRHASAAAFAADVREEETRTAPLSSRWKSAGVICGLAIVMAAGLTTVSRLPRPATPRSQPSSPPRIAAAPRAAPAIAPRVGTRSADVMFFRVEDSLPYVTESHDVGLFQEWQAPPRTYLGPVSNGCECFVIYRFDFTAPVSTAQLIAGSRCWDFTTEAGGQGRGSAAIDASGDGVAWSTIGDTISTQAWGECWTLDEPLPKSVLGRQSLWIRVRLYSEGCPNVGYSVAQFGRDRDDPSQPTFRIIAELEPHALQESAPRTD